MVNCSVMSGMKKMMCMLKGRAKLHEASLSQQTVPCKYDGELQLPFK